MRSQIEIKNKFFKYVEKQSQKVILQCAFSRICVQRYKDCTIAFEWKTILQLDSCEEDLCVHNSRPP